jgi:hypothetical protein
MTTVSASVSKAYRQLSFMWLQRVFKCNRFILSHFTRPNIPSQAGVLDEPLTDTPHSSQSAEKRGFWRRQTESLLSHVRHPMTFSLKTCVNCKQFFYIVGTKLQGDSKISIHRANGLFIHKHALYGYHYIDITYGCLSHKCRTRVNTSGDIHSHASRMTSFRWSMYCIFNWYTVASKCPHK